MKHEANGQGGDHIIVLDGVEVQLFYSPIDGRVVVQIDGAPATRDRLGVMVNEAEVFNDVID